MGAALQELSAENLTGEWELDQKASSVTFTIKHFFFLTADGSFPVKSGTVELGDDLAVNRLTVAVDAAGFDTGNPKRDTAVRSAQFLEVERYPEITFTADKVAKADGTWEVPGALTVKDKTLPQVFAVDATASKLDGDRIEIKATTQVDRREYGVSAMGAIVGPHLHVSVTAVFARKGA